METLIIIIILVFVIRRAVREGSIGWQSSKAANRKSTRGQRVSRRAASAVQHDVGYWGHQLIHGFPTARHGLAAGWRDARTMQDQGYAARQKAKADHLGLRARLIPEIQAHRRRQEEALEQIRAARQPEPEPASLQPSEARPPGQPSTPPGQTAQPATPAAQPTPTPPPSTTPTPSTAKGNTAMAGDTNYTEQINELAALKRDAEEAAATVATRRMLSRLDALQGMGLDAATLADAAEIDDALKDFEKAAQRLLDAAGAAYDGLVARHGGIKAAVDDSPVDKPADGGFYQD